MAKCAYCGEEAGLLKKVHKECEAKHKGGMQEISSRATTLALGGAQLAAGEEAINALAKASYVSNDELRGLLQYAFLAGVDKALDDGELTREEEDSLASYKTHFGLSQDALNANGAYLKLVKAALLRDVMEGKIPERMKVEAQLPFNFMKSEKLVWLFQSVPYFEPRTRRSYVGGYSGVSLRVARGVYYRVGGFKGNPVLQTETVQIDTSLMGVTDKHVYFTGSVKSFRLKYQKIVSFSAFSDRIAIQRDAASAKPQIFKTGDGWFTYNLLTNLSNLSAPYHLARWDRGCGAILEQALYDRDGSGEATLINPGPSARRR